MMIYHYGEPETEAGHRPDTHHCSMNYTAPRLGQVVLPGTTRYFPVSGILHTRDVSQKCRRIVVYRSSVLKSRPHLLGGGSDRNGGPKARKMRHLGKRSRVAWAANETRQNKQTSELNKKYTSSTVLLENEK